MKNTFIGTVTSDSADKTIVVTVRVRKTHPIYKKQFTSTSKYMVHDEKNTAKVGNKVLISETKPVSSKKRFELSKIIDRPELSQSEKEVVNELTDVDEQTTSSDQEDSK